MCPHSSSRTKYVFAFYNLLCVSVCVISVYIWVYLVWGVWDKEGGNRAVAHHSSYVRCFSQSAWQECCKVHREFQDMFRGGKRLPSLTQSWNSCSRGDTPRHAHFLIRTQCFSLLYNRLSKKNTLDKHAALLRNRRMNKVKHTFTSNCGTATLSHWKRAIRFCWRFQWDLK